MAARIIDGKAIAQRVRDQVARDVAAYKEQTGHHPGLATILVGDDEASAVYITSKHKACHEAGIVGVGHDLPADATEQEVATVIERLNADPDVSGILCQLPVPDHMDGVKLTSMIDASKDVDGLTPASAGLLSQGREGLRPCTPLGVMLMLEDVGAQLDGAHAVVLGRSNLLGKPMAQLLINANATVTTCHSHTRDLAGICRQADVLIAAVGRPQMVKGDWVKPGAIVIDVGITRGADGLVGDVDFAAASEVASAISPVPGGVGPMTIACLLRNTVQAAQTARAHVA